jgi:hypothetical protein
MIDEDLTVPETNAVNRDGGAESLNADPISQLLSDSIDTALDAAESGSDISSDSSSRYERNTGQKQSETQQDAGHQFPANFGTNPGTSTQTRQDDFDPDIAMPPNMSEKQQSNWRKLSDRYAAVKKEAAEAAVLRQQLTMAEQQRQLPPDYEDLRRFRQVWDMQNDPGFKSKYETPLSERKDRIYDLLRKHKAGDDVIKAIEDVGGPSKVPADWWYSNAINRLQKTNGLDAKRLETALMEMDDLEQSRQKELSHASQNQQEWLQAQEQERRQAWERESGEISTYVDSITKEVPWARYQDVPAGATPEQIQRIQAHNAGVQDLENKYNSALAANGGLERASVAAAATLSHVLVPQLQYEQKQNAMLQGQLAQLQKELAAIKGAGRMPRNQVAGQAPAAGNLSNRMNMNPMDAIDLGLQEAGI